MREKLKTSRPAPVRASKVPAKKRLSRAPPSQGGEGREREASAVMDVTALQRRILALTAQLAEADKKLRRKDDEVEEGAENVGKLLAELGVRDQKLKLARSDIDQREEKLRALRTEIEERDHKMRVARVEIGEREQKLRALRADGQARDGELDAARAEVAARDKRLHDMRAQLEARDQELRAARAELEARAGAQPEGPSGELREELDKREDELRSARRELERRDQAIATARAVLDVRDDELKAARDQIEDRDEALVLARAEAEHRDHQLHAARIELEKRDQELRNARTEIERRDQALVAAAADLVHRDDLLRAARAAIEEREVRLVSIPPVADEGMAERLEQAERELNALDSTYAETVVQLETAADRLRSSQEEADRLRQEVVVEREERAQRDQALTIAARRITALETDLAAAKGRNVTVRPPRIARVVSRDDTVRHARGELGWLLESLHATIEQTRVATKATATRLDEARVVFDALRTSEGGRGASDAYAGLVAASRHAERVQDTLTRTDLAATRAADTIADVGRTDPGADALDEDACSSARALIRHIWEIQDALSPLLSRDECLEEEDPDDARKTTAAGAGEAEVAKDAERALRSRIRPRFVLDPSAIRSFHGSPQIERARARVWLRFVVREVEECDPMTHHSPLSRRLTAAARRVLEMLADDARSVRSALWLRAFNATPDLLTLKHVRSALLRMNGVDIPIRATYVRSPQYLEPTTQLRVGRGTFINSRCHFDGGAEISIGTDCNIGPLCNFECTNHRGVSNRELERRSITIGNRVWLGAAVTVLPGAYVDDDTVVAAGAVVKGHLRGGGLWGGVPARQIRDAQGNSLSGESPPSSRANAYRGN